MNSKSNTKTNFTIDIESELLTMLYAQAEDEGLSVSEVILRNLELQTLAHLKAKNKPRTIADLPSPNHSTTAFHFRRVLQEPQTEEDDVVARLSGIISVPNDWDYKKELENRVI